MIQSELFTTLKLTNFPVVYHSFKSAGITVPNPPYIIYLFTTSDNTGADNKVYAKSGNYNVELYTNKKDIQAELTLENVLDNAEIYYEKIETFIEEEGLFEVLYQINI